MRPCRWLSEFDIVSEYLRQGHQIPARQDDGTGPAPDHDLRIDRQAKAAQRPINIHLRVAGKHRQIVAGPVAHAWRQRYQTVVEWADKFGRDYARSIRLRSRGSFADKWHPDEVVFAIKGGKYWLWRAVDADRYVLNETVQSRRDTKAANWLLTRLLKTAGRPPKRIIIEKLRSYDAAKREIEPEIGSRTTAIQ